MNDIPLELFISFVCIIVLAAVFAGDLLIRFVVYRKVVEVELLARQINILPVDLIEIMRSAAVDFDLMDRAAEHIVNKSRRDGALTV